MSSSSEAEESSQASRARDKQRRKRVEKYSSGDDDSSESDDDDTIALNQFSQILLQSVQALGILNAEQMKQLIFGIITDMNGEETAEEITAEFIQKRIDTINQTINPLNMTIRKVVCEISETTMYMFYTTIESPVMKFLTSFSEYEVELFENVMKVILEKEDFMVPLSSLAKCRDMVKLETKPPKTTSQIYKMLEKFTELKYLVASDPEEEEAGGHGGITLGVRAIREMEALLQDTHKGTVGHCCLCKNLILNGLKCGKCDSDFHQHCFKSFIATTTQCPNSKCKTELPALELMAKRTRQPQDDNKMDIATNGSGPDSEENGPNGTAGSDSDDSDQ